MRVVVIKKEDRDREGCVQKCPIVRIDHLGGKGGGTMEVVEGKGVGWGGGYL